jgi:hypothetical protein
MYGDRDLSEGGEDSDSEEKQDGEDDADGEDGDAESQRDRD